MATRAEQFAQSQDMLKNAGVDIYKYNAAIAGGASVQDALKAGGWTGQKASTASTTTATPISTTSTRTTTQNTGLNSMSSQVAQNNSRNFQVGTGDVAEMPQQPKAQSVQQTSSNIGKAWEGLTYEQQQERLNRTAGLKDALAKKGIVSKTQPTTTTQPKTTIQQRTTQPQTPKQDQWDYQDNSQARMNQIADNLEGYRQTMPQLFDDMSAFYNFFIKDKGRSQDQIDFLWDYFNRVQKYGKYDNMSPDALGTGIANGTIPEDYLNTLKTTDPQKYQEVISYKKDTEDRIMNESYLNDVVSMAGIEGWESEPSSIQYGKRNGIWLDENGDLIDDRRYHAPTEEELQLSQEDSEYEAEKLRLKNAYKDLQSDLTEQYPDADLSTIMILTSDRGTKIQKALDTISVAQTKTQGRLSYLQNERETMDKAGADSIAQLQKNLGMYYQYSPEGIAELAQAQYGATNITLDQADSGNETQKQMALQSVLDDYYAKYGSIIQRGEQQVINDVIAYAKKNGVGLAQALQENFVKPLQSKPEFTQLNTIPSTNPEIVKVGDNAYAYWDDNGNLVPVGGAITGTGVGTMRTERNNNPTAMTTDVAKSLGGVEGVDYIQGDSFKTGDGRTLYTAKLIGNPIETTIKLLDNAASTGKGAFYTQGGAQRWKHTAMSDAEWLKLTPEQKQNVVLNMLQREGGDISKMAYYNQGGQAGAGADGYNPEMIELFKLWRDVPKDKTADQKNFWTLYGDEISAAGLSKNDFSKQYDNWYTEETMDAKLDILSDLDHLIELTGKEFDRGEKASVLIGKGTAGVLYNRIKNNLTLDNLIKQKNSGAKLGVLSDSDVRMIADAASTLDWSTDKETWRDALNKFRQSLLSSNELLKEKYKYQSAYSTNRGFKYNDDDKSFTFGTRKDQSGTQGATQGTTTQAKSIKNLTKVNR